MPSFNPGMESCASVLLAARKPCPSSFCGPALSTAFHKWLPQLWASSLDGELLPCRRCVIPATGGNASASPQCWRMQAALLHPQRCFVGLSDFYILQMAATKQLKAFNDPKIWGGILLKSHIRRQNNSHFLPLRCSFLPGWLYLNFSPKLSPSGDLIWCSKSLCAEIFMNRCLWSFSCKICVCGSHQVSSLLLPCPSQFCRWCFLQGISQCSSVEFNFSLLFLCQKQSQPFCLHFEQCL